MNLLNTTFFLLLCLSAGPATLHASYWRDTDSWKEVINDGKYLVVIADSSNYGVLYGRDDIEKRIEKEHPVFFTKMLSQGYGRFVDGIYEIASGKRITDFPNSLYILEGSVWISDDETHRAWLEVGSVDYLITFENPSGTFSHSIRGLHYPRAVVDITESFIEQGPSFERMEDRMRITTEEQIWNFWIASIPLGKQTYVFDLQTGNLLERIDHQKSFFIGIMIASCLVIAAGFIALVWFCKKTGVPSRVRCLIR